MYTTPLVVFDMDGMLYSNNSWIALHRAFGLSDEEDQVLLRWYEEGVLDYRKWTELIATVYRVRGLAGQALAREVIQRCTIAPDADYVIRELRCLGYHIALLSGGVDLFVAHVAERLGITLFKANHRLVFDSVGQFTDLQLAAEDDELFKSDCLHALCRELGIQPTECFCIGDGRNDRAIFSLTGRGILICPPTRRPPFTGYWKRAADLREALAYIVDSANGTIA
jgi:phosphoserine phosphatase